MQICRVKGSVVSTTKSEKMQGLKLLLVKPVDLDTFEEKGSLVVAIDTVDAGEGELVMTVGGSSSRQTSVTENKPCDQSIIAVIDSIDLEGKRIFEKYGNAAGGDA